MLQPPEQARIVPVLAVPATDVADVLLRVAPAWGALL
jgi:hypothetical protein